MGQILYHTALLAPSLQGADPWSIASAIGITVMDLGSVHNRERTGREIV